MTVTIRKAAAILLALTMGCGKSPTATPGPATSLVITPSTLEFTAIRDSVQLIGRAYDASGNEVATGSMSWRSADQAIVNVSPSGLVISIGVGETKVTGSLSSGITASVPATVTQTVAALEISDAQIELSALTETRQISVSAVDARGVRVIGRTYAWSSSDEAIVTVSSGGFVTAVGNGVATVAAEADGVSDSVPVTVDQIPKGMAVTPTFSFFESPGSRFDVTAEVLDSLGYPVGDAVVTWKSSDKTVATVTPDGVVDVVGTGSAGIFASSWGFEGAAAITVGSAGDWSAVGEWRTYQGNEAHTGFVPVDLDVGSFAESWTATPVPGVPLNPVTIEGAHVAFSTNTRFGVGTQKAGVLSAATGASRWLHDFPAIHSVHPPAIRDGTVYLTTGGHDDSHLWAFDAVSGYGNFARSYGNQWYRYYAPVVTSGKVYMAGGYYGGMYRFDATTGAEDWFVETNQYDQWSPAVKDARVYAYTGEYFPHLQIVDAETGLELGQIADPNFVWGGWSMDLAPVITASDHMVAAQGSRLLAFDLSGNSISWEVKDQFTGQVTAADGVLYVTNNGMLEARSEADGSYLWSWTAPHWTVHGPFLATRNVILASTSQALYAVHVGSHRAVWSANLPGTFALAPDGHLYVVTGDRVTRIAVR